ncbi:MAG TPA: GNAT family N-acetyltransferase [Candidatus Bathyarchaeia archaeon]|jgi:GNAT superfamily N-acetyltransferase|nr:GNAT family N-acetyltransferase [Candidatus Bathyarchaeia archaeon]
MGAYRIRPALPEDLPIVLEHRRRMFEGMGYADPATLDAVSETSAPLLGRGLADGSYRGWLAEAGSSIVAGGGIVILDFQSHPIDPRPRRAFVVNMYTDPAHRRKGLARRLMETMIAWARAEGHATIYLHASDEGRGLYESLGFTPTNEMRLMLNGGRQCC